MNGIYVVIAVNTAGALGANTLKGCVFFADNQQYLGSWQEGTSHLNTVCQDGQLIMWSAVSLDPKNHVEILGFSGEMVDQKICFPRQNILPNKRVFTGLVETQGGYGGYAYIVILSMDGKELSVNAQLKVV